MDLFFYLPHLSGILIDERSSRHYRHSIRYECLGMRSQQKFIARLGTADTMILRLDAINSSSGRMPLTHKHYIIIITIIACRARRKSFVVVGKAPLLNSARMLNTHTPISIGVRRHLDIELKTRCSTEWAHLAHN